MIAVALESEDAPTTNRTSIRNRRIEVITGRERRRRWTADQKREIAAESLLPGVSPVMVARKYGISSGLLIHGGNGCCAALSARWPTRSRVSCALMSWLGSHTWRQPHLKLWSWHHPQRLRRRQPPSRTVGSRSYCRVARRCVSMQR